VFQGLTLVPNCRASAAEVVTFVLSISGAMWALKESPRREGVGPWCETSAGDKRACWRHRDQRRDTLVSESHPRL